SVPIFNALLAFAFFRDQRVAGAQLAGVAVGFVGVALLVGAQPAGKILGAVAVVGMAACYGLGGLLTRRLLVGVKPQVVSLGTSLAAAVVVSLRRATAADADWLVGLYGGDDVDPFLGPPSARDREAILTEIERSEREPRAFGRFVIELDGDRAGALGFHEESEANAIARLEGLAVHPSFRGR